MLKLLLREDRHSLRREYFTRLVIVLLVAISIVLVIWSIFLAAAYVQVFFERDVVSNQLEDIRNSDVTKERLRVEELSDSIEDKLGQLTGTSVAPSLIIRELIEGQPVGIGINALNVSFSTREEGYFANIEIGGVASTRANLVEFQKVLLSKDIFDAVDIPYSNLTKNTDVSFAISVVSVELIEFLENEE